MAEWTRTGRMSPVDSRTFPGGSAMVVRRTGGKWEGTVTITVEAGDDAKARAKVDAIVAAISKMETVARPRDVVNLDYCACGEVLVDGAKCSLDSAPYDEGMGLAP